MNILAIETATEACSAALLVNKQMSKESRVAPQQHSQLILPMVDGLLVKANIEVASLDYLAFSRGPGSFTGVRIATGMVQGLAMSAEIPVVGISTLATMAQNAFAEHQAEFVAAAIDARMGEVYFGLYHKGVNGVMQLIGEEQVLAPTAATELLRQFALERGTPFYTVGTGWQSYPLILEAEEQVNSLAMSTDILYPDAEFMLPLAEAMIQNDQAVGAAEAQPLYVRDKVTWKKLPGRE